MSNGIYKFDSADGACEVLMTKLNDEGKKIQAATEKQANESYKEEIVELQNVCYEFEDSSKMLMSYKNLHPTPWWIVAETLSEMLAIHPHITQKYAPKVFDWAYKLPPNKIPCYSYGSRWSEGNALLNIYKNLKNNPTSKRAVVPIFNVHDTDPNTPDVPCTLLHRYIIRDNKLSVNVLWRSHDIYSGLFKVDLHLAYFLQNTMISWLNAEGNNYEPGKIFCTDYSLHYYPRKNSTEMEKLCQEFGKTTSIYGKDKIDFPTLKIDEYYKELNRTRYCEEVSYGNGFDWVFNKIDDMQTPFFRDWSRIIALKNAFTHKNELAIKKLYNELEFDVNKRWLELQEGDKILQYKY